MTIISFDKSLSQIYIQDAVRREGVGEVLASQKAYNFIWALANFVASLTHYAGRLPAMDSYPV